MVMLEEKNASAVSRRTARVVEAVSNYYGVPIITLLSPKHTLSVSRIRQIGMYLMRGVLVLSYEEISIAWGRSNHTTSRHGCEQVKQRMSGDPAMARQVRMLEQVLRERIGE